MEQKLYVGDIVRIGDAPALYAVRYTTLAGDRANCEALTPDALHQLGHGQWKDLSDLVLVKGGPARELRLGMIQPQ